MSDGFDIDDTIANLERKFNIPSTQSAHISSDIMSGGGHSGSKWQMMKKIGISAVISAVLIAVMKPMRLHTIKYDDTKEECVAQLSVMKTIVAFVAMTAVFYMIQTYFL